MRKQNVTASQDENLVKVSFLIGLKDGSHLWDEPWASDLGNDRYKLINIPYFIPSVSLGDIMYAPYVQCGHSQKHQCQHVIEKSGNRTIRAYFPPRDEASTIPDDLPQALYDLGCDHLENAMGVLICANVPPHVDIATIAQYLDALNIAWKQSDPLSAEPHQKTVSLDVRNQ